MSTLKERMEAALAARQGATKAGLSRACGISKASVSNWFSGDTLSLDATNLIRASAYLSVRPEWLATGRGPMHPTDGSRPLDPGQQTEGDGDSVQLPIERRSGNSEEPTTNPALVPISVWDDNTPLGADEVELKFLKTWISRSGSGYAEDTIYDEGKRLRMGKITLQKAGVNAETSVVGLNKGDSNEPVIPDGGAVYVDRSKRQIIDGEVYAIYHEGEFRVKLLYRLPGGGLRIRSYNRAEYPDEDYPAGWEEKIRIEGWVWNWSPPIRKWRGK